MSISNDYLDLFRNIALQIKLPRIKSILLPIEDENAEKKDQFGFVILQDDSVGAFYTSLDDTLDFLKKEYPDEVSLTLECSSVINDFDHDLLPRRALALGAINAASQHVIKRSCFLPPDKKSSQVNSSGIHQAKAGDKIGMVGYFSPLIERLLEKNINVLVLEKIPERVDLRPGLELSEDVADLSTCEHIVCTASTLINQTLEEVLSHCRPAKSFSLIGPSSSSLPDVLFNHGVDAVGGFQFHDIPAIKQALLDQQPWGHAGNKYQLTPNDYPGIDNLLQQIHNA